MYLQPCGPYCLHLCPSQCCWMTRSIGVTWELIRRQYLRPCPRLLEIESAFLQNIIWILWALKHEKHCHSTDVLPKSNKPLKICHWILKHNYPQMLPISTVTEGAPLPWKLDGFWAGEDVEKWRFGCLRVGGLAFPGALDKGRLVREAHVWLSW